MHQENHGWFPVALADLVGLIPILAAAYGIVLGGVALVTGWQLFTSTTPNRRRRGAEAREGAGRGPAGW